MANEIQTESGSNKTMVVALVVVLAIIAAIFMMNYHKADSTNTAGETVGNGMATTGQAIENAAAPTGHAIDNTVNNTTDK